MRSFTETSLNEPVKYKVRHIANKMELLDREIKYLLNKVKIWRTKQEAAANNQTDDKAERTTEDQQEPPIDSTTEFDAEKEKYAKEETASGNAKEQEREEPVLETEDNVTQDPLVISESEKLRPSEEKVEEKVHQEL